MYTRNTRSVQRQRTPRYDPPPGYGGNTFPVKHHLPEDILEEQIPRRSVQEADGNYTSNEDDGIRDESSPIDSNPLTCQGEEKNGESIVENVLFSEKHCGKSPFGELLGELTETLRGKIGTEELIILTVMLLISSDGMCAEVLVLALCLIAG